MLIKVKLKLDVDRSCQGLFGLFLKSSHAAPVQARQSLEQLSPNLFEGFGPTNKAVFYILRPGAA